jgi:hypothetical protein
MGFTETIVNIGTQFMQGHLPLTDSLASSNFQPAKSSATVYLNSLSASLQRSEGRLSHGSSERDSIFEPFSYAPRHQLSFEFCVVNFSDC